MDKIKMWNWYGESFEKKVNDSKISYKNFVDQAQNVFDRKKRDLDLKKKVDKDLFLRAKTKLQDEQKRALKTLKISHTNETLVIKETIKQLKIAQSLSNLIIFEIKKIDKKLKESAIYVANYYKMIQTTADDVEVKEANMTSIIDKAKAEEKIELFKKSLLTIIYKYNKQFKSEELNLENLTSDGFSSKLVAQEKEVLNSQENISLVKELFRSLVDKKNRLLIQREKSKEKFALTKKESKIAYKQSKKQLKKDYAQRILDAEYSYNKEYAQNLDLLKAELKERKAKIVEKKADLVSAAKNKQEALKDYNKQNKAIEKSIKKAYKQEKILAKKLFKLHTQYTKLLATVNFLGLSEKHIQRIYFAIKNLLIDKYQNGAKNDQQIKEEYKHFSLVAQKYEAAAKNLKPEQKEKLAIHKNANLPLLLQLKYRKNAVDYAKVNYYRKLSAAKKEYSYDSEFLAKKADALEEYINDTNKIFNASKREIKKSKLELNFLKHHADPKKEQASAQKRELLKKELEDKKAALAQKLKAKEITKKAYEFKIREAKIIYKEKINEFKLHDDKLKNKILVKTQFSRTNAKVKITKKIYESKVVEAIKQVPTENKKLARWKGFLLNLLFPGLAQIFLFKEYKKGAILLAFSALIYFLFIPFSFGLVWTKMGGIQGLVDLGASQHDSSLGILPDARFWMFGGAASIVLLAISAGFIIASAISAYRRGKFLEEGMRPQNWTQTKNWLSNQGFPWLISIPGWFLIAFIIIIPLMTSLFISLSNIGFQHTPPGQTVDWVGFGQFGKWWIFRNNGLISSLFKVFTWTIIWTFGAGFSVIVVGTLFAILVNSEKVKFKKFFRLVYIIPWAIPAFVTIIFLKSIFQADGESLVNYILIKIGLIDQGINYFASANTIRFLLIVIQTWLGHSYIFLLITGNLQSIPKDIYEAGEIDGAKKVSLFRHLTLPILVSSLAPLLIGQFTFMFNNFTIISLFSGGGPQYLDASVFKEGATDILISWIYKLTGSIALEGNVAFASALVIVSSLMSVSIAAYGFAKNAARREQ
ncbi:ABC transporter permease subunit [Mycoplasma procyoni]|uniref:ABC transporter permease subunit n=1 Tax=Mycoplasma procyoni TaxID=568784 RepID=UPI00197BB63B|nr:ABC transporter permease subunit [Mycoplasma procyoni]MBN3534897.1 ABC transporter permease subunit [Mycoplasma procyoni]